METRVVRRWCLGASLLLAVFGAALSTLFACGGGQRTTAAGEVSASPTTPAAVVSPGSSAVPHPVPTVAGTLVFARVTEEPGGLFTVHPDGTGLTLLSPAGGWSFHQVKVDPSWSPDGRRLAYVTGDPPTLWVVNADGTGGHVLMRGGEFVQKPTWSPDGERIAFSRYAIAVLASDGSDTASTITSGGRGTDWFPVWSPDGGIFFLRSWGSGVGLRSAVYRVEPDGSGLTRVTSRHGNLGVFAISPDGKQMVVHDHTNDCLVLMATTGRGSPTVLVDGLIKLLGPTWWEADSTEWEVYSSWSPDGKAIAFAGSDPWTMFGSDIYVVNADGSDLSVVPKTGDAWMPAWRPE